MTACTWAKRCSRVKCVLWRQSASCCRKQKTVCFPSLVGFYRSMCTALVLASPRFYCSFSRQVDGNHVGGCIFKADDLGFDKQVSFFSKNVTLITWVQNKKHCRWDGRCCDVLLSHSLLSHYSGFLINTFFVWVWFCSDLFRSFFFFFCGCIIQHDTFAHPPIDITYLLTITHI